MDKTDTSREENLFIKILARRVMEQLTAGYACTYIDNCET
jgi:hypothetical protein